MDLAQTQAYSFIIYILSGFLIGIFFDAFRIFRKSFNTSDWVTYIQDFIFWICTGVFLLFIIFKFNNGELRLYIFLGLFIGIVLYILMFSRYFININVKVVKSLSTFVVKIWYILSIPLKWLRKKFFNPISFVFINVRKKLLKTKLKK